MADNEIIKALECCSFHGLLKCEKCPKKNEGVTCMYALNKDALDLINRQQAEIERYKGVIKLLENDVTDAQAELKEFKALYVNKVAAMGIKAFAERLKAEYADFDELHEEIRYDNLILAIDNLVKEMTEQSANYGSSKTEGNQ